MLKRILTALSVCCFVLVSAVSAQDTTNGGLVVRSTPPGAEARLSGDAILAGITPTFFQQQLVGSYKLEVKKRGYEKYSTSVTLDPSRQMEISVNLTPKTRFKAAIRSMLIPGWGQRYTEKKGRGWLFHAFAAGSVVAYLIADDEFDYRYDLFQEKRVAFDSANAAGAGYTDMQRLHGELVDAQDEAYDAEDVRRVTIGVVAGIWALSLVDALFFFPEREGAINVQGLTIQPMASPQRVGLTLSHRF